MSTKIEAALARIESFENDSDNLAQLEEDAANIFEAGLADQHLNLFFRLFELLPIEDNEVLWGIMHGLEEVSGYEPELLGFLRRQPSSMGVIMLNRLLNAGEKVIEGTELLSLLRIVIDNPAAKEAVREQAEEFLAYQLAKHRRP